MTGDAASDAPVTTLAAGSAVLGIAGWSGAGKTTLIEAVLPRLAARGLVVSTVKHAHHGAELDRPGKDSWRHRQAGAREVLLTTPGRWALIHEEPGTEPGLPDLLARMAAVDLILVEGFRQYPFPKLEVHRPALGKPPLWPDWPDVAAVASDAALPDCDRAVLPLGNPDAIASWIVSFMHRLRPQP